jgi:hypothetical protein
LLNVNSKQAVIAPKVAAGSIKISVPLMGQEEGAAPEVS